MATPNIYVNALCTPKTQWQWNTLILSTSAFWAGYLASSGSVNAEAVFPFYAQAGTYTLDLVHGRLTNRGIYTIDIDGTTVGTVDGYAASFTAVRSTLTGVVIPTTGAHDLRLVMATKNASSTSYGGFVNGVMLTRTGA